MKIEEILRKAKGVKIDSREIEKGDIFIGLKGEKFHGSFFANHAIERGAIYSFVEKGWKNKLKPDDKIIEVEDTLKFLWEIAKIKREINKKVKIIGLTGSTGKTTVKDVIYHFLHKMGKKAVKSKKSYNNFIGVPLTLYEIKENTEYLVCEIGTNKKGEIKKLTELVRPDAGIITKIGPSHIEFFEGIDEIFEEKISLFRGIENPSYLIFNENSYGSEKIKNMFNNAVSFNVEKERYSIEDDTVKLFYKGIEFVYSGGGYALLENLLCALKCIECEDFEIKHLAESLEDFNLPPLRMEKVKKGEITYIYDCYNSNPVSMGSLLKTYKNAKKRKILVMGDMLELGKYTEKYHRDSAHLAKENGVEILLCIGEHTVYTVQEAREISLKAEHFDKLSELASRLKNITDEGDLVLIKGSRKMQMEKLKEYT